MCFKVDTPKVPDAPPVPNKNAEDAKRRRAAEAQAAEASQGRQATIITSPLGDPSFGENVKRTRLGGV